MVEPDASIVDRVSASKPVPFWMKIVYSAFVAFLVPYYWQEYGPTNFLYYCDVALFLALITIWTEKPLCASMAAVGITLPQLFWQFDFLGSLVGLPITGMTAYMFDEGVSAIARGLSFFHFWLPVLLLYLVWRLGYDRRAWIAWTLLAWALMLVAYFWVPGPGDPVAHPNQPRNVNYVFGFSDEKRQTWMPGWAWLGCLMVGLPLFVFLPTHWMLCWFDSLRPRSAPR